ncbi:MAG: hypothetical protein GY811_23360 [Myxococcales bacterium]|nr:hypothetical protein [Myxococcales bacterium]
MGKLALALAVCVFALALVPAGTYWAMGGAGFAATLGVLAYRRRDTPGWSRLAGAGALTIALAALVLSGGRFAVTWWAVGRLSNLLA